MNLKQLETFVRVAEIGSFSKAALVLDTVQPALSRQVRQLEIDLHVTLLERTGRGVVLTEAGKRLFEHSVGILALVARAREDLESSRDEPAGRVVVGLPPSLGKQLTVPLVETFKQQWPRARLAVVEGLSAHIAEWIATGRVDIGLLYSPEPQAALEAEPLRAEPLCLVSRAGRSRQTTSTPVTLAELAGIPLVIPERLHAIRRLLEAQAALAGIKLDIAWEISSVPAILALVRDGHGHAVLTREALANDGQAQPLVARPIVEPVLVNTLFLATSATKRVTPLQRSVLRWLREHLARPQAPGARA
jgi:LysR family transcriptional regulator, nitrogen assimilation regulatory protein